MVVKMQVIGAAIAVVIHTNGGMAVFPQCMHKLAADKPGSTRYQNLHNQHPPLQIGSNDGACIFFDWFFPPFAGHKLVFVFQVAPAQFEQADAKAGELIVGYLVFLPPADGEERTFCLRWQRARIMQSLKYNVSGNFYNNRLPAVALRTGSGRCPGR